MSNHFQEIYAHKAATYDRMIRREDYEGNLPAALAEIVHLDGLDVVEFGAGTGRLTRMLAPHVRRIFAFDIAPSMLKVARETLPADASNWSLAVGDNRTMPVRSHCADLVIAGWSFGHATEWFTDCWRDEIGAALAEMRRILKPGGTAIIIETMGTGTATPAPPHPDLAAFYKWLEEEHGFAYRWIRMDYRFETVEEGEELMSFFFGEDLAEQVRTGRLLFVPQCTGIWWRKID